MLAYQSPTFINSNIQKITMTTKNTEKRLSDIEDMLLKLVEERAKPSRLRQLWNRGKPYIIPFILGMIVGGAAVSLLLAAGNFPAPQATLKHQAAMGGAVIPFPNGKPSPMPSAPPPQNSTTESTASSWTNPYEPPLPANPQADNGLTESTRLFRRLTRPTP